MTVNYSQFPVGRISELYHRLLQQLAAQGISEENFVLKGFYGESRYFFIDNDKLSRVIERNLPNDFGIEGFAKSEAVFDKKSYNKSFNLLGNSLKMEFCANDYEEYFQQCFCNIKDEKEIVQSVKNIINYPQTKSIARRPVFDFTLLSTFNVHKNNRSECYGKITVEIPIFTIGQETQNLANNFTLLLLALNSLFDNITGSVAIATKACIHRNTYMTYFGDRILTLDPGKNDIPLKEITQTQYIDSVEWFNLISPMHAEQLSGRKKEDGSYSIVDLSNGSQIIRSSKGLLETDIETIRQIKKYLYPVLFPGEEQYRICDVLSDKMNISKPRRYWELAPVLDNEILVENGNLIYRYNRDNI